MFKSGFIVTASVAMTIAVAQASTPTATGLAAPGCQNQSNPPIVVHRELPGAADTLASPARTVVVVKLAHTGRVTEIALSRSSGSAAFDRAALAAVKSTGFAPAARGCVAIDATFYYAIARDNAGHVTAIVLPNQTAARDS